MAKYRVIKYFTDLQDNNHAYHEGDVFPREGLDVPNGRLIELSTDKNRRKTPLIEEISEEVIENTDVEEDISVTQEDTSEEKAASNPSKKGRAKRNTKEA